MRIERNNEEIKICFPAHLGINVEMLSRLIEEIRMEELLAQSNATQEQIDALAQEISTQWWKTNQKRFLKEQE